MISTIRRRRTRLETVRRRLGLSGGSPDSAARPDQWEIVDDLATRIRPILSELIRHAANGEVVHNDDTSIDHITCSITGRR